MNGIVADFICDDRKSTGDRYASLFPTGWEEVIFELEDEPRAADLRSLLGGLGAAIRSAEDLVRRTTLTVEQHVVPCAVMSGEPPSAASDRWAS